MLYVENECDLLREVEILQKAVNESSEHTKRQLDAIKSNFSLEAIVSIIVAIGIPYYLDIFAKYWIPSAFIIIIVLGLYSILKTKIPKLTDFEQNRDRFSDFDPDQISFTMGVIIKNLNPFFKALSILYIISLFIVLVITPTWFNIFTLSSYAPVLACILLSTIQFKITQFEHFFLIYNL